MKFLVDLDLGKVCHLNNTLLEDTGVTVPSSYYSVADGGSPNQAGLIAHYNAKVYYFGKTTGGVTAWSSLATNAELTSLTSGVTTANRVVITNGSGALASSGQWGVNGNDLDLGVSGTNRKIINLLDPTNPQDAATKNYVDNMAAGLRDFKRSCLFATTGVLTGSTWNAGTAGVTPATITGAPQIAFDTPGVVVAVNHRVLVKDQTGGNALQNGIYEITNITGYSTYDLRRTTDAFISGDLSDGTVVFVEKGTLWGSSMWVIAGSGSAPTLNTNDILWVLFSSVASITAGAGLVMSGATLAVNLGSDTSLRIVSDVLGITPSATANRVLTTGGSTSATVWGQVDLTTMVSGILPSANGGTGIDTNVTVAGSILYKSGVGAWSTATVTGGGTTIQVPVILDKTVGTVTWGNTTGSASVVLSTSPTITTPTIITSIATSSAIFDLFNSNVTTLNAFGTVTTLNLGGTTAGSTINIGNSATLAAATKTINIGTLGALSSITNINFGSAVAGATGTAAFQNILLTATSPQFTTSITSPAAAFTLLDAATSLIAFSAATSVTTSQNVTTMYVGNTTAAAQNVFMFGGSTGASTYNFAGGATAGATTKTINIGANGVGTSVTNINIGSAVSGGGGTTKLYNAVVVGDGVTGKFFSIADSVVTPTKQIAFSTSLITASNIRKLIVQDTDGIVAYIVGTGSTGNNLGQFASTTSAQLASVLSDETGWNSTGLVVFNNGPSITAPLITTGIKDVNGNLMFGFIPTASAVNYFTFTNSATTAGAVYLATTGTDANIALQLEPKSTGVTSSAWGAVKWKDASTGSYQALRMCRTWGFTLSTANPDRAGVALVGTFGSATTFTFTHDFGTQDILVMFTEISTGAMVQADWTRTSGSETKQITVNFKTAPTSGAYRVTIIG